MTPAERLDQLERGQNPREIARLPSGWAVMGDSQFLPGYCLLLASPLVPSLNDLDEEHQLIFLRDMARLGAAVRAATGCRRINYSIYGNLDPFLHAHVWPRYDNEDPAYATLPPLTIPSFVREDPARAYDPAEHDHLLRQIADRLTGVVIS